MYNVLSLPNECPEHETISEFRTEIKLHKRKIRKCGDIIDITDSSKIRPHFLQDRNKILYFVESASGYDSW